MSEEPKSEEPTGVIRLAKKRWLNRRSKHNERSQFRFGFGGCEVLIGSTNWSGDLWYAVVGVPDVEYEIPQQHRDLLKRLRKEWHFLGAMHEFEDFDAHTLENMNVFIMACNRSMDRYQTGPIQLQGTKYRNHLYVAEETKRIISGLSYPKFPRNAAG